MLMIPPATDPLRALRLRHSAEGSEARTLRHIPQAQSRTAAFPHARRLLLRVRVCDPRGTEPPRGHSSAVPVSPFFRRSANEDVTVRFHAHTRLSGQENRLLTGTRIDSRH